jgi:ATP-dependent protease HslVU (ClpYQ) peptidase subunit
MVINQRGGIALVEEGTFLIVPEPFAAIGSGKGVALGALHAGASAVDAVKAAMKVDVYSGGRVFTAEL